LKNSVYTIKKKSNDNSYDFRGIKNKEDKTFNNITIILLSIYWRYS